MSAKPAPEPVQKDISDWWILLFLLPLLLVVDLKSVTIPYKINDMMAYRAVAGHLAKFILGLLMLKFHRWFGWNFFEFGWLPFVLFYVPLFLFVDLFVGFCAVDAAIYSLCETHPSMFECPQDFKGDCF